MLKKLLYTICGVLLVAGCSDDDTSSYYVDELVIDTANCYAEGSYVQGAATNDLCRVRIPYENGRGGTARISAPETNGLRIDEQQVEIASGAGEAVVAVTGMPLLLETSFLQLNVEYQGQTYLSSVEIAVLEDADPTGAITFEIDQTPLMNLTEARSIAFTVDPTMASVVESGTTPDGLRVQITSDPATGAGSVTLTPTAGFLGGEVELSATFGARTPQVRTIRVSAFAAGDGSEESPYEVSSADGLARMAYGLDACFRLAADITLDTEWTPVGSSESPFTGTVSGGNAVGGIGGVCCSVRDCYVSGSVQATNVSSSSTAAAAGISAAAKGDVERCVVSGVRITGSPKGSSATAGIINVKNGNAPKTTRCAVLSTTIQAGGFAIYGTASADITATENYRWNVLYADETPYTPLAEDPYGQDGVEQEPSQTFFEGLGYDFTSVWEWDTAASAPKLQHVGCDETIKIQ